MNDRKNTFSYRNVLYVLLLFVRESLGGCPTPSSCGVDLCSTGCKQSPINISPSSAVEIDVPPIRFIDHWSADMILKMAIAGDTVLLKPSKEFKMSIDGGPLSSKYILDQLHFHWGESDTNGTEHCIDGNKYTMEAHLVYYNCLYSCIQEAIGKMDGVAIIAVLFESKPTFVNSHLEPIVSALDKLKTPGAQVPVKKNVFQMFRDILESQEYFAYEGSLTTPPCSENVLWLVYKNFVYCHCAQVSPFRELVNEKCIPIRLNWRRSQPLNGRTVYNARATTCSC